MAPTLVDTMKHRRTMRVADLIEGCDRITRGLVAHLRTYGDGDALARMPLVAFQRLRFNSYGD